MERRIEARTSKRLQNGSLPTAQVPPLASEWMETTAISGEESCQRTRCESCAGDSLRAPLSGLRPRRIHNSPPSTGFELDCPRLASRQ